MTKKPKGFGKQKEIPTRDTRKFLLVLEERIAKYGLDSEKVYKLIETKLDESFLETLPLVFNQLIANKTLQERKNIAGLFCDFGTLLGQFPRGDCQLNQEISITVLQLALKVFTREEFPQKWAGAQNNLANIYRNRIRGERAENLEKAITVHELALKVRDRSVFPQDWAFTQNNLANAYKNRIRGKRDENLEKAIAAYELALQVLTRSAFPQDWAKTQNNLANAYSERIRGERAENLEKAISGYESALQVRTRSAFSQDWARTQNNLGLAYSERIRGERAENLEKAISGYESALQVLTRSAFPQDWGLAQNNLANAYGERIRGERAENLEKAIAAYKLVLQVLTRSTFPQKWSMTQGNLALTRLKQFELTQKVKYLDEAIAALQAALDIAIPRTDTYITINYILGRALDHRYKLDRQLADLEQAILSYRLAAENTPWEFDRADYLEKAGDSQYELGVALTQSGQWYKGLAALEASLKTYRQVNNRLARADALQQMARTHYLMSNFDQARTYFRDALRLYLAEKNAIGEAHCRAGLGRLFLRLNFIEDALQELEQACELYRQLGDETRLKEIQDVYQLARKIKEKQPL